MIDNVSYYDYFRIYLSECRDPDFIISLHRINDTNGYYQLPVVWLVLREKRKRENH